MTEQRTKRFVEEIIGLFELSGWEDMQEAMAADLAQRGPEKLERDFERTAELLRGIESTAEGSLGYGGYLLLGEAKKHAEIAQHICESYAQGEQS